jgi:nucleoid DNA-binding protein
MTVIPLSKSNVTKSRSLKDFFMKYPYRKNPEYTGTIPVPYIKKEEVSKHKWTITYDEYAEIIKDIFEEIAKKLQEGETWEIGSRLGHFTLKKAKVKTFFDRVASNNAGKVVKKARNDYENYMIVSDWERKFIPLRNKWLWRFSLVRGLYREIYEKTDKDFTHIHKFKDK